MLAAHIKNNFSVGTGFLFQTGEGWLSLVLFFGWQIYINEDSSDWISIKNRENIAVVMNIIFSSVKLLQLLLQDSSDARKTVQEVKDWMCFMSYYIENSLIPKVYIIYGRQEWNHTDSRQNGLNMYLYRLRAWIEYTTERESCYSTGFENQQCCSVQLKIVQRLSW